MGKWWHLERNGGGGKGGGRSWRIPVGLTELPDPKQNRGAPKVPAVGAPWTLQSPGPQKDPWSPQISAARLPHGPQKDPGTLEQTHGALKTSNLRVPRGPHRSPKAPTGRCPMNSIKPVTLVKLIHLPRNPDSGVSHGTHRPIITRGSPMPGNLSYPAPLTLLLVSPVQRSQSPG